MHIPTAASPSPPLSLRSYGSSRGPLLCGRTVPRSPSSRLLPWSDFASRAIARGGLLNRTFRDQTVMTTWSSR